MKFFTPLLLWPLIVFSADVPSIDSNRPFLDKLRSRESVRFTDFEYPFLIAQTGAAVEQPIETVAGWVRAFLESKKLPLPSHFSSEKSPGKLELPEPIRTGKQLEAITECKEEKCQVKLSNALEKKTMEASADRLKTFQTILNQRLDAFLHKRELRGYEDRADNQDYVKKMLETFPFFTSRYPDLGKYFAEGFWKGQPAPKGFVRSLMKQEVVDLAPDRMQPIWRIAEAFEIRQGDRWVFFELHPYSNHYLDSSLRVYEVFQTEKRSLVILTDIMEIDELTKSGLIRMLYKGKMEDAVIEAQAQDIKTLLR